MADYKLFTGDCLSVAAGFPAMAFDAVIADLPYGTTGANWDDVVPFDWHVETALNGRNKSKVYYKSDWFDPDRLKDGLEYYKALEFWEANKRPGLWQIIKHVVKPNAPVVLFGSEPFSTGLRASNLSWFRYDWVWDKVNVSNPQLAKYQPLKHHEIISIFSKDTAVYYPQGLKRNPKQRRPDSAMNGVGHIAKSKEYVQEFTGYPKAILRFGLDSNTVHPTQKPIALMRYLVRTYTKPGQRVLDLTMGSGTTGAAAVELGREFWGIDNDPKWVDYSRRRIANVNGEYTLTAAEEATGQRSLLSRLV